MQNPSVRAELRSAPTIYAMQIKNALNPNRDESDMFPWYHPNSASITDTALWMSSNAGLAEQTTLV
jgi:hypothetical protein